MTRMNLAHNMARILEIPPNQAAPLVDAFLLALAKSLHEGHRVELRGFGAFTPYTKKARGGVRNVYAGTPAPPLPDRPGIRFRAYKSLLEGKNKC